MKRRKNSYFKFFSLFFAIIVLVLIAGCNGTPPAAPIINSFLANPSTITVGESSNLSWSVTDATTVTIDNGIGSVALSGTTTVTPVTTTTYTLTATNSTGSITAPITIIVGLAYGLIDVNSTPVGARVYLDGVDTGQVTPIILTSVTAGAHTIKLDLYLYKHWESSVIVVAGGTIYLNPALISAPTQTITLQPGAADGKDAYVYENTPTNNYNTWGLDIGTITGPKIYRSYLQFDLSSVPSTAVIVDAKLGLYYSWSWLTTWFYIGLYEVTDSWGEDTITWNNQPASSSVEETIIYVPVSPTSGFKYWYIGDLVKAWYDGSISNYGMVLRDNNESSVQGSASFSSSDHLNISEHPILEIDYYLP